MSMDIILSTINARYEHPSLGLRYLAAQLGAQAGQRASCRILEFASKTPNASIIEQIARLNPRILGLGIYIWNTAQFFELLPLLRKRLPETILVGGGPEISHSSEKHPVFPFLDHIIEGEADHAFPDLCLKLLSGGHAEKVLRPAPVEVKALASPYPLYTSEDLRTRFTYVEASRGCPFTCEFCLSAIDIPVRRFELEPFLDQLRELFARGARRFKFIDRTFNLSTSFSGSILRFLLPFAREGAFFHFEIVPDRLAPELLELASLYPPGTLQFEVGIQTFNPTVAERIGRRQDFEATARNLSWLRTQSHVHLHADLIVGLPGEDLKSFGAGFDRLWALKPQEIQVGILKKLHGAPIARHDSEWQMRYSATPPYEVLTTSHMDARTLDRLKFFARTFELYSNRGRFESLLDLLVSKSAFEQFLSFSDWLSEILENLHAVPLDRQVELLARYLITQRSCSKERVTESLMKDYRSKPGRKETCLRAILNNIETDFEDRL